MKLKGYHFKLEEQKMGKFKLICKRQGNKMRDVVSLLISKYIIDNLDIKQTLDNQGSKVKNENFSSL